MGSIFGSFTKAISNSLITIGIGNRIFNIVNADGKELGYAPQVDWNTTPQNGSSLSALLEWRTRLTPLIGRDVETKQLIEWANEPHALSFKIMQAQGGVGKTRLAAEVAQKLVDTKAWTAGFVSLIDFHGAQRLRWQGHWLVVVDYPEHAPARLVELLRAAKAGLTNGKNDKLRVLLLCRSPEGVHDKLSDASVNGYLSSPLQLGELPLIDNFELLTKALAKLTTNATNLHPVSEAEFTAWQGQSRLHHTALFVIALAIHLAGAPGAGHRFLPGKDLLLNLVGREQTRWHKAEGGLHLSRGTLADVVAMATLFNGLAATEINSALTAAYAWNDASRTSLFTALGEVWPAHQTPTHVYPSMAPDLLAAAYLWQWQSTAAKQGNAQDIAALTALAKHKDADIAAILQRWHMLAYDQTMRLDLGPSNQAGAISALLYSAFDNHAHFAKQLKLGFSSAAQWPALAVLAVAASRPASGGEHSEDNSKLATRAQELNNHAVDLAGAGDRAGSLAAAREAVDIYRRLAKAAPASFEPALASSINNLANRLSETGDRAGALAAAREAVDIRRRLAQAAPASFEPALAVSLCTLMECLAGDHQSSEARLVGTQALSLFEQLNQQHVGVFEDQVEQTRRILQALPAEQALGGGWVGAFR